MEPEKQEIIFRHYQVENLDFSYALKINLLRDDISESKGEDHTDYILSLEPDKRFHGRRRGVVIGRGYFDISLVVDKPLDARIEDLVGSGEPLGRIYFEKEGWGKKARYHWFYKHEVDIPKGSESGIAPYIGDHLIDVEMAIPLQPERPVDLKLRLKSTGDLTRLATIEAV
jgi:hypothetical protein